MSLVDNFMRRANGRWHSILQEIGIAKEFLRNAHGPCPICGGNDRFRWDDKDGRGTFYCGTCGAGDGLKLAQLYTGKDVVTLIKEIDPEAHKPEPVRQAPNRDAASERIRRVLRESRLLKDFSGGVVRKYLKNRGVSASKELREHPGLKYFNENGEVLGVYPAMVAAITDGENIGSLHITYLTSDGQKAPVPSPKKVLPVQRPIDGMAIRLTGEYETLAVAEGIETALAVIAMYARPCWACINAGNMEKFVIPPGVKALDIFGDTDDSYTGHKAAYTLAMRAKKQGLHVMVHFPPDGDYADMAKRIAG